MDEEPNDPFVSPHVEGASVFHGIFTGYVQGGFTEDQALKITIAIILDGIAASRAGLLPPPVTP